MAIEEQAAPRPGTGIRAETIVELLRGALAHQRDNFARSVDGQVLQHACIALQDLQEIHRAQPTEALLGAIFNLTTAVDSLRLLIEEQEVVDAALEARAERVLHEAMGER